VFGGLKEASSFKMKVVIQRVKSASVTVDGTLISTIGKGLLAFAAVDKDDTITDTVKSAEKLLKFRLWDGEDGKKWKLNVQDIGGEILCVSQFTLLASTKKGNKPDFHKSAEPVKAKVLYDSFFTKVQELYSKDKVKDGLFQAMMDVSLVNDGPVTIEINTDPKPLDLPSNSLSKTVRTTMDMAELGEQLKKLSKAAEFKIPSELLE